jgi:hypothetical protein
MRRTELGRGYASGLGQSSKGFVTALCAFEDLAGDMPTNRVFFSPNREDLACPFEGDFHIGKRPDIKTFCNHGRLVCLRCLALTGQTKLNAARATKKDPRDVAANR